VTGCNVEEAEWRVEGEDYGGRRGLMGLCGLFLKFNW